MTKGHETGSTPAVVCISPAPWDSPIWTNRQHIINVLARDRIVIYVFHTTYMRSVLKRFLVGVPGQRFTLVRRMQPNLWVVTTPSLPFGAHLRTIHRLNIKMGGVLVNRLIRRLGLQDYILWFYDPEAVEYTNILIPTARLVCYDCVDEFVTMPQYSRASQRKRLQKLERQLLRQSDLVTVTSSKLLETKSPYNKYTWLVENVGDYCNFHTAAHGNLPVPVDFPNLRPIIGFVGAVTNYKVDFELIREVADTHPKWTILLIGPIGSDTSRVMTTQDNVIWFGPRSYADLPGYVAHFDACIIPYRINDYTKAVFPIKFFEFLSTGKPIVSTKLPSLEAYSDLVPLAVSSTEFIRALENVLENDSPEERDRRLKIAQEHTWETRAQEIMKYVNRRLSEIKR